MTATPITSSESIQHLATLRPASTSRTWQSTSHPSLPLLATACADKTIRIYSLTTFTLLSTLTGGHRRSVRCCAWKPSPSDRQAHSHLATDSLSKKNSRSPITPPVLASGSFDATAAIWVGPIPNGVRVGDENIDVTQGDREQPNHYDSDDGEDDYRFAVVLEGHESEIKSLAWSAHGTFLATSSRDKSVWVWECLDTNPTFGDEGGGFGALSAGVAEDEDNYETVAVLQEHDGDVKCVAWHPEDDRCLASASYDEMVRVWREDSDGEWRCVGVCQGHEGTVWCVAWEPVLSPDASADRVDPAAMDSDDGSAEPIAVSGPRLLTCADDLTLRLWRRKPKTLVKQQSGPKMPSIIRSASDEEEWFEEGRLPQRHERAVYTVAWSARSTRVVSAGSDGRIVVYEERGKTEETAEPRLPVANGHHELRSTSAWARQKEWMIIAEFENAHGVFEINHVCWAPRWDRGKRSPEEEVIVSTGDDGEVRVWTLDEP